MVLGANLLYYNQNNSHSLNLVNQDQWSSDLGGHGIIAKKIAEKYLFGKLSWAVAFKNGFTTEENYYLLQRHFNAGLFYQTKKLKFQQAILKINSYLGGEFF